MLLEHQVIIKQLMTLNNSTSIESMPHVFPSPIHIDEVWEVYMSVECETFVWVLHEMHAQVRHTLIGRAKRDSIEILVYLLENVNISELSSLIFLAGSIQIKFQSD